MTMAIQDKNAMQRIMQTPNVLGYVHCSLTGEVLEREGSEVESLATVLGHFVRLSSRAGTSFGADGFHEAQIEGKAITVLCMPCDDGAIGVVLDARARVPEVALSMRRIMDEH
jgi:predicted regulator of Ras-like GTPase activity (Roadblock/LC7/MglB family)